MPTETTAPRPGETVTDRHDRKLEVAYVLLDRSMGELDDALGMLGRRDKKGELVPLAGADMSGARTLLDEALGHGLLALEELREIQHRQSVGVIEELRETLAGRSAARPS